ncbi:MAG: hypothetical protein ACR2LE_08330 [Nocardioidaceae bacterium]
MTEQNHEDDNASVTGRQTSGVHDSLMDDDSAEAVGRSDAAADAARTGADVEPDAAVMRDTEGVAEGSDDVAEDMRRSGA